MEEAEKQNIDELKKKIEQNSVELKKINEEKENKYKEKNKLDKLLFSFIKKANEIRDKKKRTDTDIYQLKISRKGLNSELKNLFSKFKVIKQDRRPKGSGAEQLKKQIATIQFSIETEALSFEREKSYMEKINQLKSQLSEIEKTSANGNPKEFKRGLFDKKKIADETHEKIITLATESSKDFENLTDLSKKISDIKKKKSELQNSLKDYKEKIDSLNQTLENCLQEWAKVAPMDASIKKPEVDVISRLKDKRTLTKDDILELQRKTFRKR